MRHLDLKKVGIFLVLVLAVAGMALARGDHYRIYSPYGRSTFDIGYENGYQDGFRHGEQDRYASVNYNYSHSREYKKAERGYHRSFGDKGEYRYGYRDGYVTGYNKGYYRHSYNNSHTRYGDYRGYGDWYDR
jgi:hypothetical protein